MDLSEVSFLDFLQKNHRTISRLADHVHQARIQLEKTPFEGFPSFGKYMYFLQQGDELLTKYTLYQTDIFSLL